MNMGFECSFNVLPRCRGEVHSDVEFDIEVLSRDQIISSVWGYDTEALSNVVDIYIHFLRDKVDRGFSHSLIKTVRGMGYKIVG